MGSGVSENGRSPGRRLRVVSAALHQTLYPFAEPDEICLICARDAIEWHSTAFLRGDRGQLKALDREWRFRVTSCLSCWSVHLLYYTTGSTVSGGKPERAFEAMKFLLFGGLERIHRLVARLFGDRMC